MNREIVTKRDVDRRLNKAEFEIIRLKGLLKEIENTAYEEGRRSGLLEGVEWVISTFRTNAVHHGNYVDEMRANGTWVSNEETIFLQRAAEQIQQMLKIMEQKVGNKND